MEPGTPIDETQPEDDLDESEDEFELVDIDDAPSVEPIVVVDHTDTDDGPV